MNLRTLKEELIYKEKEDQVNISRSGGLPLSLPQIREDFEKEKSSKMAELLDK